MGNLCSIFHNKLDLLKSQAGSLAKAEFLDKCLFWWQISNYTIKNSSHTWFTRTTDQMAKEVGCSERTIRRYLADLIDKGLIEKQVRERYSKTHGKHITSLHIRITDKLLAILKTYTTTSQAPKEKQTDSKNLPQNDRTCSDSLSVPSYNKEKEYKYNNNTVSQNDNVNLGDNKESHLHSTPKQTLTFEIEKKIGEIVSIEVKNQVKGMMVNLEKQHGIILNNKERLFAEIIYSLINPQQFSGIKSATHKINIISKLLRQKRWSTPKGFYNHFETGQDFKQRDINAHKKILNQKLENELLGVECPKQIAEIKERFRILLEDETRTQNPTNSSKNNEKPFSNRANELNREIASERKHLEKCLNDFEKGVNYVTQSLIDSINNKIEKLNEELESYHQKFDKCA